MLRRYLAWLHERTYAKGSIVRRISELRSFYNYLRRRGIVERNPVSLIRAPKLPRRLPRPLNVEEVYALLNQPDEATPAGQRDRAMLEMLYAAGLRVSELVGLDVDAVDLVNGQVRVLGKGDKERVVLIGVPAVEALRAYLTVMGGPAAETTEERRGTGRRRTEGCRRRPGAENGELARGARPQGRQNRCF